MKVYIAAPFFSEVQLSIVRRVERRLAAYGIEYFSPREVGVLKDMSVDDQMKSKKEIFDGNIKNMDECTHMVACIEHKDTGTTFEIGYYFAKEKPVVLFHDHPERINVMLAEAAHALIDDTIWLHNGLRGESSCKVTSLT
jgi:nucleoside 2-deoxyribosyltransferase